MEVGLRNHRNAHSQDGAAVQTGDGPFVLAGLLPHGLWGRGPADRPTVSIIDYVELKLCLTCGTGFQTGVSGDGLRLIETGRGSGQVIGSGGGKLDKGRR